MAAPGPEAAESLGTRDSLALRFAAAEEVTPERVEEKSGGRCAGIDPDGAAGKAPERAEEESGEGSSKKLSCRAPKPRRGLLPLAPDLPLLSCSPAAPLPPVAELLLPPAALPVRRGVTTLRRLQ